MKVCNQCNHELPYSDFVKDKHSKDGYTSKCKKCRNKQKKEYRRTCADKIKAYQSEYDRKRRDQERLARQQWRDDHKEQIDLISVLRKILSKKNATEYRSKNKEQYNIIRKKKYWDDHDNELQKRRDSYANNPAIQFYNRQKRHKRKALERKQVATLTWEQWNECLSYFNHSCVYCGTTDNITQEHIIPLVKGGSYTKHNIVPACSCCNLGRRAELMEQWYKKQSFFSIDRLRRLQRWHRVDGQAGLFEDGEKMNWK